jgi:EH domain-containing protein 1
VTDSVVFCFYVFAAELFEMEERDLMRDLRDLPRNSAVRKINEIVKRVRLAKVHAYVIGYLKEQMPMLMGHAKKQKEVSTFTLFHFHTFCCALSLSLSLWSISLIYSFWFLSSVSLMCVIQLIEQLPTVFRSVMKRFNLAHGDFPNIEDFRLKLAEQDFTKFHSLKQKLIDDADHVLGVEFPRLMEALPRSQDAYAMKQATLAAAPPVPPMGEVMVEANPFGDDDDGQNPFGESNPWALAEYIPTYESQFASVQSNGFVTGAAAKGVLGNSGLPVSQLRPIWDLSDVDKDGKLDLHEFVIAMFLIDMAKKGHALPARLDDEMIPPHKK